MTYTIWYPSDFTTFDDIEDDLKGQTSDSLSNDLTQLKKRIRNASSMIAKWTKRTFVPYIKSDFEMFYFQAYNGYIIDLPDDNLSLTSIKEDDDTTIDSTYYQLVGKGFNLNKRPYRFIDLSYQQYIVNTNSVGLRPKFTYDGIWGFSETTYANSWETVTTLNNGGSLNATDTTCTVTSADNFKVLDYIRMDSEFMQVTAVNTDTEVLTIRRAVNGSTGAVHSDGVNVERWLVNNEIGYATSLLASWLYQTRQSPNNAVVFGDGTVARATYPQYITETVNKYSLEMEMTPI